MELILGVIAKHRALSASALFYASGSNKAAVSVRSLAYQPPPKPIPVNTTVETRWRS